MSIRQINELKFEYTVPVGDYNYADYIEFTKEGIDICGDIIRWEEINIARRKLESNPE